MGMGGWKEHTGNACEEQPACIVKCSQVVAGAYKIHTMQGKCSLWSWEVYTSITSYVTLECIGESNTYPGCYRGNVSCNPITDSV